MTTPRALRAMFVANDGLSVGHVMRCLAVARALGRRARQRTLEVRALLVTTSRADTLLAAEDSVAIVRLPAPATARRAGFTDPERRRLVRGAIEGVASSFAPDLVVADTFPSGPHGELALGHDARDGRRRALLRRSITESRADDPALSAGLEAYDLAIVADDPGPVAVRLPVARVLRVPPITLTEARDGVSRQDARAALGLPAEGRAILVTSGGGGDDEARAVARSIAQMIREIDPSITVTLALGPLAGPDDGGARRDPGIVELSRPVLAPLFSAFDGAFAPAGYNTAHELAKAGVPASLFARPRPFDDQAARAARFAAASLARALDTVDRDAIADALDWMPRARLAPLEAGGADRAADALLDLVTSPRQTA